MLVNRISCREMSCSTDRVRWNSMSAKRYNTNVEKIKSGNILDVAEVVRDLSHRHMERGLSIGEKKMLSTAKDILLSELVLSQNMSHDMLDEKVESVIKTSYELGVENESLLKNTSEEDSTTNLF